MNHIPPSSPNQGLPPRQPARHLDSDHLGLLALAAVAGAYWMLFTGTPTVASKLQEATVAYLQASIDGNACTQTPDAGAAK